jgi:sulfoxide reductase heme-binding subunit YedZ
LAPLIHLTVGALAGDLGADPVEAIARSTGLWTLNLLFAALAAALLCDLTDRPWLARWWRMAALFALLYASLHGLAYAVFDHSFDWPGIAEDVGRRPFIAVGVIGLALVVPVAAASSGATRLRLERLTYLAAAVAVFHYLWLAKQDIAAPAAYALALCLLLWARTQGLRGGAPVRDSGSRARAVTPAARTLKNQRSSTVRRIG